MTESVSDIGEVVITRNFDAPREPVFDCMTDPAHLTHLWGPVGVSTPAENITVDLRVAGVFETVMVNGSNGEQYRSKGVFTGICRSSVLAWKETEGMVNRSTFADLGNNRTEVRIH